MRAARKDEIRVGIYVGSALLLGIFVTFLLGSQSGLFAAHRHYRTHFEDVDGLREGGRVRVSGLLAGSIEALELLEDGRIEVSFKVRERYTGRITDRATARLGNKGLLGDKLLQIDVEAGGKALEDGATIPSEVPLQLSRFLEKAGTIVQDVETTSHNLARLTGELATEGFVKDVQKTASGLAVLTHTLTEGEGLVPALLHDASLRHEADTLVGEASEAARGARKLMDNLSEITAGALQSNSLTHELLMGDGGEETIVALRNFSEQLALTLKEVREGDSAVHALLFEEESGAAVKAIGKASASLERILARVEAGEGTVGALLSDPTLYEDLKALVGDLERNTILKALVRHAIRQSPGSEN